MSELSYKEVLSFSSKIKRGKDSDCWEWLGSGETPTVKAWEVYNETKLNHTLVMLCKNNKCANPNHMDIKK